jgi:hypothetical protein
VARLGGWLLLLVVVGAACTQDREVEALREQVAQARIAREDTRAALAEERERFDRFRDAVAHQAQLDMVNNVIDAARIGGAAASGCAIPYTDPGCDVWWVDEPPPPYGYGYSWGRNWARRQLRQFPYWRPILSGTYGRELVKRTSEEVGAEWQPTRQEWPQQSDSQFARS